MQDYQNFISSAALFILRADILHFKKGEFKMFFQGINNFEELKKEYRRLAKLHHPDREGGSDTEFKKLNSEYEKKTAELLIYIPIWLY